MCCTVYYIKPINFRSKQLPFFYIANVTAFNASNEQQYLLMNCFLLRPTFINQRSQTNLEVAPSFYPGSMIPCRSPALQTTAAKQFSSSDNCVLGPGNNMEADPTIPQSLGHKQQGLDYNEIKKKQRTRVTKKDCRLIL